MEEADGRKIGLDGAGRLAVLLHPEDIGGQMLAADIGQFLEVVLICQISAETLHSLIIPIFRAEAALSIMPRQLVQLAYKRQKNALVLNSHSHI